MTIGQVMLFIGGLLAGAAAVWVFMRSQQAVARIEAQSVRSERDRLAGDVARLVATAETLRGELEEARTALARGEATLEAEQRQSREKLEVLKGAREDLLNQFKAAAADLMDEKGRKLVELGETTIGQTIQPLKDELAGFRQKVEEVYLTEGKERSALGKQLEILTELNGNLRQDAANLTKALKGDSKTQGDWGEVILGRLLDSAGLAEGQHYRTQEPHTGDNGERLIPDVVLYLPNDRQMVVDSKVTLTAYSAFAAADEEATRDVHLKAHLDATRRHIKGLSEKNYQALYNLTSVDFVVMFMPLEGAFMTAIGRDENLFQFAWERNVLLVSPSTLLFVVRTIAHVWRQEAQSKNAQDIAKRGATLYDKFVAFTTDLTRVGESIDRANAAYIEARKKLSEGGGNLVRQAEMLRKLGVKPTKTLAPDLVESGGDIDDDDDPKRLPPAVEE